MITASAQLAAWRKVCALVSGAALAPTVDVLRRAGALDRLLDAARPDAVGDLADACGLHEAYTHVAMVLLATQGLLERRVPDGVTERASVFLTAAGRDWVRRCEAYAGAVARMDDARAMRAALLENGPAGVAGRAPDSAAVDPLGERVSLHTRGPMVASIVGALGRLGALRRLYRAPLGWLGLEEIGAPRAALEDALPVLVELGWVARDGDLLALTPEGRGAARWAPLFNYVYGYLRVYERAVSLLRGDGPEVTGEARDDSDRDLLLTGKAYVFRTGLRGPVEELLRGLFASETRTPALVVDMNAGDGTVLAAVAEIHRGSGSIGGLQLVALVRNPLAQARCRDALETLRVPHRVVRVDFSDPDEVARALAERGLSLHDALVVSKTTIHDRRFRGPRESPLLPVDGRATEAVFVSPDGEWIDPRAMEDDLAAFFASWRRYLGPHGMIAIDTHAVAPEIAARTWSENAVTHVAASHGYSSQYLIECERFREAARRAGLSSRFRRDLGTDRVGAVTMSLDHFVP